MDCSNKPSMEKLLALQEEKSERFKKDMDERKRYELAVSLRICPCCSSPIISEPIEIFDKPKTFLFGLIKIKKKRWDYRNICSTDKNHYEDKGFYSDDSCYY